MKTFKTMCIRAIAGLSLLVTASFSANATLISQDILDLDAGVVLGSITVKMDDSRYNTGPADNFWAGGLTLVEFELSGFASFAAELDPYFSDVEIDTNNLFAGIQYIGFDGDDIGFGADTWSYQLGYQAGIFGFLDVFENASGDVVYFSNVGLGAASVVSAPGTMGLMMLAMGAVYLRRRRQA